MLPRKLLHPKTRPNILFIAVDDMLCYLASHDATQLIGQSNSQFGKALYELNEEGGVIISNLKSGLVVHGRVGLG